MASQVVQIGNWLPQKVCSLEMLKLKALAPSMGSLPPPCPRPFLPASIHPSLFLPSFPSPHSFLNLVAPSIPQSLTIIIAHSPPGHVWCYPYYHPSSSVWKTQPFHQSAHQLSAPEARSVCSSFVYTLPHSVWRHWGFRFTCYGICCYLNWPVSLPVNASVRMTSPYKEYRRWQNSSDFFLPKQNLFLFYAWIKAVCLLSQ